MTPGSCPSRSTIGTIASAAQEPSRGTRICRPGPRRSPARRAESAMAAMGGFTGAIEPSSREQPGVIPVTTDVAQRVNPETRAAWERSRQAAITIGLVESKYFPMLTLAALGGYKSVASPAPKDVVPSGCNPILDLSLLDLPTFRAAIVGGSLFRIGIGALPFLLPLLLQIAFGLNPLQSGLLTFASAAGALTMRLAANPLLVRFGFKRVLLGTTVIGAGSIATCATFTPHTPEAVILLVLLAGGFFRSLQFTSVNVLAYVEVARERLSHATSFAGTAQQLSLSMGVGTAALILHLTVGEAARTGLSSLDFIPAFLIVAAMSASAALVYARLPADAGAGLIRDPLRRSLSQPSES